MNESLLQPRLYSDTFKGGTFELEMRENISLVGPFNASREEMQSWDNADSGLRAKIKAMWEPLMSV